MSNRCFAFVAAAVLAQAPAGVQTFALRDAAGLTAPGVKAEGATYKGRRCVKITVEGEDKAGPVFLPGTDFQDGTIEADIALKALMPPGVPFPGFVDPLRYSFAARPATSIFTFAQVSMARSAWDS